MNLTSSFRKWCINSFTYSGSISFVQSVSRYFISKFIPKFNNFFSNFFAFGCFIACVKSFTYVNVVLIYELILRFYTTISCYFSYGQFLYKNRKSYSRFENYFFPLLGKFYLDNRHRTNCRSLFFGQK